VFGGKTSWKVATWKIKMEEDGRITLTFNIHALQLMNNPTDQALHYHTTTLLTLQLNLAGRATV
jgi:hypothetical protein